MLSAQERLDLIVEVGNEFQAKTESFEPIGSWLAYLLLAIADGGGVEIWPYPEYVEFKKILDDSFPAGHPVWKHIIVLEEG